MFPDTTKQGCAESRGAAPSPLPPPPPPVPGSKSSLRSFASFACERERRRLSSTLGGTSGELLTGEYGQYSLIGRVRQHGGWGHFPGDMCAPSACPNGPRWPCSSVSWPSAHSQAFCETIWNSFILDVVFAMGASRAGALSKTQKLFRQVYVRRLYIHLDCLGRSVQAARALYLILDFCNLLHGRHGEMKPLGRPTGVCFLLPTHAALQGELICNQADEGSMRLSQEEEGPLAFPTM